MIKNLVIDRATWKNSYHGVGPTYLLNRQGYRCCLGFLGKACGLNDNQLDVIGKPSLFKQQHIKELFPDALFELGPEYCTNEYILININDNNYSDVVRESLIVEKFKELLDIDVSFSGDYQYDI
jgi:hypothetical protein